jgi:hypothetical protein
MMMRAGLPKILMGNIEVREQDAWCFLDMMHMAGSTYLCIGGESPSSNFSTGFIFKFFSQVILRTKKTARIAWLDVLIGIRDILFTN